jgi:glycine betaine/choline ABC-type transport system substrate-binding protein
LYPDYTGTILSLLPGTPREEMVNDENHRVSAINERLSTSSFDQIEALARFSFSNSYRIVVRRDWLTRETTLTDRTQFPRTISEFTGLLRTRDPSASKLTFVTTPDFLYRADGREGLVAKYGNEFSAAMMNYETALHKDKYPSIESGEADIIDAYETDAELEILKDNLVELDDDQGVFPHYYATPVVNRHMLEFWPEIADLFETFDMQVDDIRMLLGKAELQELTAESLTHHSDQEKLKSIVAEFLGSRRTRNATQEIDEGARQDSTLGR